MNERAYVAEWLEAALGAPSPAVGDGLVFVIGFDGRVYAFVQ